MKIPSVLVLAALFSAFAHPAPAAPETLPAEAALLYYKLINEVPPYDEYILANKDIALPERNSKAREAAIQEHRDALRLVYDRAGFDTLVVSHAPLKLVDADLEKKRFAFDFATDKPVMFRVSDYDMYGVFVRNAVDAAFLVPPYVVYKDMNAAEGMTALDSDIAAEIILKPVAADKEPFRPGKETVKVILADMLSLKLFDGNGNVILEKRFKDWTPEEEPGSDNPSMIVPRL